MTQTEPQTSTTPTAPVSGRTVWVNGRYVPETEAAVSIFDSALMFGDMVFEMTRSFNRRQFKLREHLDRLYRSARVLRIAEPMPVDELEKVAMEVIEHNQPHMDEDEEDRLMVNLSRGILTSYHPIFGGDPGPTLIISSFPLSYTIASFAGVFDDGLHAVTPLQRAIPADLLDPKMKNRSRLFYMMANQQVSVVDDPNVWALLLDPDGFVAEGTGANFFVVSDGELWTPEPRNILRGITRNHTMELATRAGITVREKNIELYDVINADEAFFTSTPACIYPCVKINGQPLGDGQIGVMTRQLIDAWSADVGLDIVEQTRRYAKRAQHASLAQGATAYRFGQRKG